MLDSPGVQIFFHRVAGILLRGDPRVTPGANSRGENPKVDVPRAFLQISHLEQGSSSKVRHLEVESHTVFSFIVHTRVTITHR